MSSQIAEYVQTQLKKQPEKKELTLPQRAKRGVVWFFACMVLLTIVSRAANAALVPKVTTGSTSSGSISLNYFAQGTWTADAVRHVRVPQGNLRIGSVAVKEGQTVTAGEPLFSYDLTSLQEAVSLVEVQLERYRLQKAEIETGGGTSVQSADLSLENARLDLQTAQEKLDNETNGLADKKREAYEDALFSYGILERQRDAEITAAKKNLRDLENAIDTQGPSALSSLHAAEAAFTVLEANWEMQLAEPKRALDKAQADWLAVQNGTFDVKKELSAYYDAVTAAERAVLSAELSKGQARLDEKDAQVRKGYQVQAIELSIQEEQKKHNALNGLLEGGGVVTSAWDGTVTKVGVTEGAMASGEETIEIAAEGLALRILMEEEDAEGYAAGDTVTLMKDGRRSDEKLTISRMEQDSATGMVAIVCEGGGGQPRYMQTQECVIEKLVPDQRLRVPIAALRQDGPGQSYVLTAVESPSILGMRYTAVRTDVTLLYHDDQYASIEGMLSRDDKLIVSTPRNIAQGDYVVIVDG